MTKFEDYAQKFQTIRFRREDGILEMTLHTNGDSMRFGPVPHGELEQAFLDIGRDPENQVIILTGTGAEFTGPAITPSSGRSVPKLTPEQWMKLGGEAKRFTMNMLAIEAPMIAAVNGPSLRHAECRSCATSSWPRRRPRSRIRRIFAAAWCRGMALTWFLPC